MYEQLFLKVFDIFLWNYQLHCLLQDFDGRIVIFNFNLSEIQKRVIASLLNGGPGFLNIPRKEGPKITFTAPLKQQFKM